MKFEHLQGSIVAMVTPFHEDGSVQTNGQGERVVTAFPTFPEKVYWPPLVRVLEREGYAADAEDNCITVTW